MYESLNIVFQILSNISGSRLDSNSDIQKNENFTHFYNQLFAEKSSKLGQNSKYTSMESLIKHFKQYSEGVRVPRGFSYKAVEAPKGEFGTSLISDGTAKPYRCKIRTPAYHHMQVMSRMVQGHYFADLVTVLGSLDIVFGDVDR